jgi:uncharacterized membrane protein YfcA
VSYPPSRDTSKRAAIIGHVTLTLLVIAAGVFLAGMVNGATGLGFSIVAGASLALLLDAKLAIVMLSLMVPLVSGLQFLRHRAEVKQSRRILPLFVGAILGVPLGTYLLAVLPGHTITLILGLFTLFYVATSVFQVRFKVMPGAERVLSPLVGFLGGISSGAVGVAGPLLASYLLAIDLAASTFVFSLSVMFMTNSLLRVVGLVGLGQITPGLAGLSMLLYVPAVLGLQIGMWLQGRLPKRTFQRAVLAVLFVAGLSLVQRGLS